MDPKDPPKDNKAKGWFCTWPQCKITKEDALDMLMPLGLAEYVIAEEEHADGESHLHAFLKLNKRVRWSATRFDLGDCHGNYQPAKSWKAVADYVKKDGNYISNLDLDSAGKHHSKKIKYTDFERDPLELLEEGVLNPMSLCNFIKNRNMY